MSQRRAASASVKIWVTVFSRFCSVTAVHRTCREQRGKGGGGGGGRGEGGRRGRGEESKEVEKREKNIQQTHQKKN